MSCLLDPLTLAGVVLKPLIGAIVPGIILLIALGFGRHQWAAWKAWQAEHGQEPPDKLDSESRFRKRQIFRRLQMSGLLAVLGASMWIGQLIPRFQWATLFVIFWCSVALLTFWLVALAMGELVIVRRQGKRLQRQLQTDRDALQREADRLREKQKTQSNGHSE